MGTKIRTYGDKVYTNFRGLNVPEDGVECEPFTIISINFLLVYQNKYYLELYLNSFVYQILNKQMIDCLYDNLFEVNEY